MKSLKLQVLSVNRRETLKNAFFDATRNQSYFERKCLELQNELQHVFHEDQPGYLCKSFFFFSSLQSSQST